MAMLCLFSAFLTSMIFSLQLSSGQNTGPVITKSPSSILVPENTPVAFDCAGICVGSCYITWYINGSSTAHSHQRELFNGEGYDFTYNNTDNTYSTTLMVNAASVHMNNTQLECVIEVFQDHHIYQYDTSDLAVLRVISGMPITPNPHIEDQSSAIILKWSPPYLWPGHRVVYYNIKTKNLVDGTMMLDWINATYDDKLVSISKQKECGEIAFEILAVSNDNETLQTFTATWITQRVLEEFDMPTVNTVMYFTANITPIVRINIELPSMICDYQEQEYKIAIDSMNESNITRLKLGPFYHRGPGTVHHDITSLIRDEEYSVQVTVFAYLNSTVSSNVSLFDTSFDDNQFQGVTHIEVCTNKTVYYYKIVIGISSCIALLVLLMCGLLIAVRMCIPWCRRNKCHVHIHPSAERVSNSLVPNPIYSGPIYASVEPKFKKLTSGTQRAAEETASLELCNSPASTSSSEEKEVRYVDQPIVGHQQLPQFRSKSFAFGACSHLPTRSNQESTTQRCSSISTSTNRKTGNKLHLTLSLRGKDGHDGTHSGTGGAGKESQAASGTNPMFKADENENYTLMSPVGTIAFSAFCEGGLSPKDVKKEYRE